ncbi:MAG TPA: hypothetical protein PK114_09740, partial [Smithellaceae bacterium]|nr:hypothetical protein [Smithellaceae bacterium]
MNIFKIAYKVVRENNDEIYRGFGFKHHSDATQYYVHPNNQSFSGTTTLCQPIGEALVLFSLLCASVEKGNNTITGDYYVSDDGNQVFFRIDLPDDWRQNGVVDSGICRYEALLDGDDITIAAYDALGRWIDGNMEHLHPQYKLLPCFCVLLARECRQNSEYGSMLLNFTENPVADAFVNLHEDFYQLHKLDEYEISYANLSGFDHEALISFRESFLVIAENKSQKEKEAEWETQISAFTAESFLPEYRFLIPRLPPELVIPKVVREIC